MSVSSMHIPTMSHFLNRKFALKQVFSAMATTSLTGILFYKTSTHHLDFVLFSGDTYVGTLARNSPILKPKSMVQLIKRKQRKKPNTSQSFWVLDIFVTSRTIRKAGAYHY